MLERDCGPCTRWAPRLESNGKIQACTEKSGREENGETTPQFQKERLRLSFWQWLNTYNFMFFYCSPRTTKEHLPVWMVAITILNFIKMYGASTLCLEPKKGRR